jgi:hypothetical protein
MNTRRCALKAIEQHDIDERQARIDAMTAEFRAAQQRRFVKHGIALWNRTEVALRQAAQAEPPPTKLN